MGGCRVPSRTAHGRRSEETSWQLAATLPKYKVTVVLSESGPHPSKDEGHTRVKVGWALAHDAVSTAADGSCMVPKWMLESWPDS